MTTRIVSIREFRKNMTGLLKEAQKKNIHFVVMRHAIPVAHVTPASRKEVALEELAREVAQARKEAKEGRLFTSAQARRMLGL
jgi:antitoxin (DNA-binding transcriptional repressor) of toxin-antitoxin stability system